MKFIDLHGHYAWNIDDGIPTKEDCRRALKKAKIQGISEIVVTPHIECGHISKEHFQSILERIEELQELAHQYGIVIRSGCELKLNEDTGETLDKKLFIPFQDTKYILCEYDLRKPTEEFIDLFDGYLYEVITRGYRPIVAHIERYFHDELDIEFIEYLIEIGCIIQINTTSVLGLGNGLHHKHALKLLQMQLVHIIATDTHRYQGARSPNMKDCYKYLYKQGFSKKYIELLMYENPKRIINKSKIINPNFKNNVIVKTMLSIKRKII